MLFQLRFTSIFLFDLCSFFAQISQDTINQTVNGKRHGYWIINGDMIKNKDYVPVAKVEEGIFNYGREGVWKKYYPSGKIKSEIKYVKGSPKGNFTTYYQNGQIEEKGS